MQKTMMLDRDDRSSSPSHHLSTFVFLVLRFTIAFEDAAPHAFTIICAGLLPICKDAFALAIMIFEVSCFPKDSQQAN